MSEVMNQLIELIKSEEVRTAMLKVAVADAASAKTGIIAGIIISIISRVLCI